ncbi:ABC transporter ATP-binding protein [Natronospirillum operosum]|uniref:ABC transporter ATP-binding protein n=1 Tax=Natronospirillum operosum TaxID=2759953 RepID=A0A4Z0WFW1_9GAMM|nr:ABC transporter ATP-binding protein [Natronospirillum operosum]TGG93380.1 ABC transporter ATP-binding protein [Natronospirillum operosum]
MTEHRPADTQGELKADGLTVFYGQHQALDHASLRVRAGEIVVILGANGAGKSTLLQTIAGLVPRSSGSVRLGERVIGTLKSHQVVESGLALVPEGRGIFGELSVEDNLRLGAYARRARGSEQENLERVYSLFPRLAERRRQIARTMSGGEQQMVAIGRAMMSNPTILMLDEPSLGLSPLLAKDVFRTLAEVRKTGLGILLVEQNAKQSLAIADRGYLIETGQIVAENSAQALMNDPAVQRAYLGGAAEAPAAPTAKAPPTPTRATAATAQQTAAPAAHSEVSFAQPAPRTVDRVSVQQVAGQSVEDLIASAEARQRQAWTSAAGPNSDATAAGSAAPASTGALDDMLRRMENAARTASTASARPPAAPAMPTRERSQQATPDDRKPEIEVYRRPQLEIYRREDDGDAQGELKLISKHRV